ncbi:hypothetical protein [Streptomyces sp. TLI_105]|uniref:hypothetical protein n=1 Tax=Streptomyces sp. TLI_105 TaxID=1881019 RepID=UPI000899D70C|nr:hypothetical protein [Streptomyces sp. TLI_105]SED41283.1 hypothetical protein SAMN05428939_5127 [Streptomyces sp. TLI_105]
MSITPSTPVVQGAKKTSLRLDGDAVLLSTPHEEARVPLAAIERIRAEGRSVTVELTAPSGTTRYVHRIAGASEAGAAMFAETVNAALPGVAGRDTTADGTVLVETRTLPMSRRTRKLRRIMGLSAGALGLLVVACVLVAVAGEPVAMVALVPGGLVLTGALAIGANALANWYREWRLIRHGITTFAAEVPDRPGMYLYTDPAGLIRHVFTWAGGIAVKVSYDPVDPGNVVLPRTALFRRGELALGLFFTLFALVGFAALATLTVAAFVDPEAISGTA